MVYIDIQHREVTLKLVYYGPALSGKTTNLQQLHELMVGHTGSLTAAMKAVETVDTGLGKIAAAIEKAGGALLFTADHGNCEMMKDPKTGGPHTAHTTNPVPIVLAGGGDAKLHDGRLADIAPTLLELMGLPKPAEMTGTSLINS